MNTRVVNLKKQGFDVRIDRQSKWGNPFIIGRNGDRSEVIAKHRSWLWSEIKAGRISLEELADLHGKTLGCHCAPLPCHGDTLASAAAWVNGQINEAGKL
jgi:hypothetical protein